MQFPESWLREFCNPPLNTEQLADLLTMSGLEVQELRPVAPRFTQVLVAQVLSVERHPNADRLSVCEVDAGADKPLRIVCGAPNVRPGIKVPCALVGAELPPGEDGEPVTIKLGSLRGVRSEGMLCSARELKIPNDSDGLLILPDDALPGRDIREQLNLDDTLFALKLTPNLGHCLSVYGVAREVSALTGVALARPCVSRAQVVYPDTLKVALEAPDLCGRFCGRIVRSVDARAITPAWMVDRLQRCGQRPVSTLVDISNYVMFEFGQPSHIFDLDKIEGGLTVRWGRCGEMLKLLNGSAVEVDHAVGVIADDKAVESLAGIMGGDASAVSDATRDVYVEAAFWWPEAVAGRSRRFGFSTEAGHRFERGVDPTPTVDHLERITQLIVEICGGDAGPIDDQTVNVPKCEPVTMRVARAQKVIGVPVRQAQCTDVMNRLGLAYSECAGVLTVTPPSWRFDLRIEEDLIEEVIRLIGYSSLPSTPPVAPVIAQVRSESGRSLYSLCHAVAALDYQETISYSFVDESWEHELAGNAEPVRVLNPIAGTQSVMRSSLLGGLIQGLRFNLARKAMRVRLFEVGRVFLRDPAAQASDTDIAGLRQPLQLAGLAYGTVDELQWGCHQREVDFFDVKGDIEALFAPRAARFTATTHPALHPGRCARIEVDGTSVGHIGELHPQWRQAYELPASPILFSVDARVPVQRALPVYAPIQRLQSVWRDLAVIVGAGVTHDDLMQTIASTPVGEIRSALLFDLFKPTEPSADITADERSMAVRLELLDDKYALTDERIDATVMQVAETLRTQLGARLRR